MLQPATAKLWALQERHQGDRRRLFSAVAAVLNVDRVFYPGCFVDIAPSYVFQRVTYLDQDRRAPGFFADTDGIAEILDRDGAAPEPDITFVHADYTGPLHLPLEHFDLLISLYAGFVSEHCTDHLRVGGTLLVNPSHGDAAMASIDPRYMLSGVVVQDDGAYRIDRSSLESHLIPKKPRAVTVDDLHRTGRGVNYTTSPFAYLFTRMH